MLSVGDTIYRAFNTGDGGGFAPQMLEVTAIAPMGFQCYVPYGSLVAFNIDDENITWFLEYGDCHNKCCKLNGYTDAFDYYCKRMGVPFESREKVKEEQMKLFGARSYEELLKYIS